MYSDDFMEKLLRRLGVDPDEADLGLESDDELIPPTTLRRLRAFSNVPVPGGDSPEERSQRRWALYERELAGDTTATEELDNLLPDEEERKRRYVRSWPFLTQEQRENAYLQGMSPPAHLVVPDPAGFHPHTYGWLPEWGPEPTAEQWALQGLPLPPNALASNDPEPVPAALPEPDFGEDGFSDAPGAATWDFEDTSGSLPFSDEDGAVRGSGDVHGSGEAGVHGDGVPAIAEVQSSPAIAETGKTVGDGSDADADGGGVPGGRPPSHSLTGNGPRRPSPLQAGKTQDWHSTDLLVRADSYATEAREAGDRDTWLLFATRIAAVRDAYDGQERASALAELQRFTEQYEKDSTSDR